jgi:hypothetical protein
MPKAKSTLSRHQLSEARSTGRVRAVATPIEADFRTGNNLRRRGSNRRSHAIRYALDSASLVASAAPVEGALERGTDRGDSFVAIFDQLLASQLLRAQCSDAHLKFRPIGGAKIIYRGSRQFQY